MPRTQADIWRTLRTKANLTDDADWAGTTQPDVGDTAMPTSAKAKVAYVALYLTDGGTVIDPEDATFTLRGVKVVDADGDQAVDATDLVVRTAAVSGTFGDEVRVPLGGALRWTVQVTGIAGSPVAADGVLIRYREAEE
jgi:hypothetical protein